MAVSFELPHDLEQSLSRELGDLSQAAKEAALVELYRQGKISHADFSRALSISRLEAEAVLKKHHVVEDLPTQAEQDAALVRLRGNPRT